MAQEMLVKTRRGRSLLTTEFWRLVATEHRNVAASALANSDLPLKTTTTWYSRERISSTRPTMAGKWTQSRGGPFAVPDSGVTPITPRTPSATIGFLDREGGGDNQAAAVAAAFVAAFRRTAPRRTGRYAGSLVLYLNGKRRTLSQIERFARDFPFKPKEAIVIVPAVAEYAAAIERAAVMRGEAGIFRKIALDLIARFPGQSIKFTYLPNDVFGIPYTPTPKAKARNAIMLPVVLISGAGQFPSSASANIGKAARRRRREMKRGRLRRKGLLQ